jgi:hypothetical protein
MNICPLTNENTACDLPGTETEGNDGGTPTVAYCQQCSQIAFRCSSGHWNRVFARFCTQCGDKLEKPATWDMASANPQRTAILSQVPSIDSLDANHGFGSWVVDIPEIEPNEDLPGLIAIDGFIIVPNPSENRLDAYKIAKPSDQKSPNLEWSIALDAPLTRGSTPVYHGLHLYYVTAGGIQRKSVLGGEAQSVNIHGVDTTQIESAPGYAPLKCEINGEPTMIVGLKQGVLLFNLTSQDGTYIKHKFFSENKVMSPALCGKHIIFTNLRGGIFSITIGTRPYKIRVKTFRHISFSAPVSLGDKVYFEALSDTGERSLACYEPIENHLSKVKDLDHEPPNSLDQRRSFFFHPLLTDGKRLFLSNRDGKTIYTYDSDGGFFSNKSLPKSDIEKRFVPHRSVVVNDRIYSTQASGLTVLDFELGFSASHQSLAMGRPTGPSPVASPIRYADKLFVLCSDRLLCTD